MEWSLLRNFAITLFALLNPLGMLPIFIGYTARERRGVQRWVALFVSLTVLVLLLIFMIILGDIGLNIISRVLGLFVAAIGVQFMVTGLINIDESVYWIDRL